MLLDDIILQVDKAEERKQTEQNDQTDLDERLRAAGEERRNSAMNRRERQTSEEQEFQESASSPRQRKKRRTKSISVESDDEDVDLIAEQMKSLVR